MAETKIIVNLPKADDSVSVEYCGVEPQAIGDDTVVVQRAFKNANNSLFLFFESAETATILAGNQYPNACLGDLTLELTGVKDVVLIEDISRFENRDGSIKLTATGSGATVVAVAKRTGMADAVNQDEINADKGYQTGFQVNTVENPNREDNRAISGNVNA